MERAWGGYNHHNPRVPRDKPEEVAAWHKAQEVATALVEGRIPDPTNGGTHFYTPSIMPRKGEPTRGFDVGGGLRFIPGVVDKDGKPIENQSPGFASAPGFSLLHTPSLAPTDFQVYSAPDNARRVH